MTTICVLGLGYIGLPTGSMLLWRATTSSASIPARASRPRSMPGLTSLDEPELQTLVTAAINSGRLKVRTRPEPADAFIIAVPTPLDTATNTADLSYVKEAARAIAPLLRRGNLVVLESTVPRARRVTCWRRSWPSRVSGLAWTCTSRTAPNVSCQGASW